jgi:hypothetical protein
VAQLLKELRVRFPIVTWIFYCHKPSGRTTALGSTHPLTEMSTRDIYLGLKVAGAYGWQTYNFHLPTVMKSGSLNLLELSGPAQACIRIVLPILYIKNTQNLDCQLRPNKCSPVSPSRYLLDLEQQLLYKHLLKQKKQTLTIHNVCLMIYKLPLWRKPATFTDTPHRSNADWLHMTFNVYRWTHLKCISGFLGSVNFEIF